MQRSERVQARAAFTLVELIIVMALLAIVAALSAPSMSRSIRARHLTDEATRFLAATEYGRDEAVSQGVPMTVWIDPATGRFGVAVKAGFEGVAAREREFEVNEDVHFELTAAAAPGEVANAVEFAPDGAPAQPSMETLRMVDRFDNSITVSRTKDGWSYEIVKEGK